MILPECKQNRKNKDIYREDAHFMNICISAVCFYYVSAGTIRLRSGKWSTGGAKTHNLSKWWGEVGENGAQVGKSGALDLNSPK